MRYQIRPLGRWLDPITDPRAGSQRFRASWDDTLNLLGYETELLGADVVVVQVDVTDAAELRRDGMLRTHAQVGFPGVRVSFSSIHGPLTYATDAYEQQYSRTLQGWQANVRAIALALESLRAVDRYGVTRRGEQYRGWTPIEAAPAAMSREQAAEFLAEWAGLGSNAALLSNPEALAAAYRAAAKRAHPDRGGDADTFTRLTAARDLLANGAGHG